jgi:Flp pilus assembly protein TadG
MNALLLSLLSTNRKKLRQPRRKGVLAVLIAILAVPLLAMVAFAVDIGWIAATQSRLQAAADAAALAGAGQLSNGFPAFAVASSGSYSSIISSAETSATTYAENFANYNGAGNVNALVLSGSDVQFGYTNSSGTYTSPVGANVYPNTITVTLRMDGGLNTTLGLFFAPVLGMSTKTLTATSQAVAYVETGISGLNYSLGINGMILPVTLDVNEWNTFVATGQSPDGTVHLGDNGKPQLQVYPSPGNAPGNFGLLSVGPPTTDTPTYANWIDSGPSPSDMQYLENNNQMPISSSSPASWAGGPGLKTPLESDFSSIMGLPRLIPVFQPASQSPYQAASSTGSNATYSIVSLVGVTISEAGLRGGNMNISVQQATVSDPTIVYSVTPAGEGSSGTPTMAPPKLTQ